MKKEKKLLQASVEMAQRYVEMTKQFIDLLNSDPLDSEKLDALNKEYAHLCDNYDWFNYEFTDPTTGKVGVKDVAGNILVPARYDEACSLGHYMGTPRAPHVMKRDGKCGIVAADGSGQELSPFAYDAAEPIHGTSLFMAWWGGADKRFGIVTPKGTVLVDNILTKVYQAENGMMVIERDGKQGIIDLNSLQVVMPEYDEVFPEPDELVLFTRDGQQGYVDTQGRFVTLQDYENDNYPGDGDFLAASSTPL